MRGFEEWTEQDIIKHNKRINANRTHEDYLQSILNDKSSNLSTENKKSKYKAKKCEYNGIKFDSQKERDRYIQLLSMQRENIIENLQIQVPFVLQDSFKLNSKTIRAIKYIADFTYIQNGEMVIEDVKRKKNSGVRHQEKNVYV